MFFVVFFTERMTFFFAGEEDEDDDEETDSYRFSFSCCRPLRANETATRDIML